MKKLLFTFATSMLFTGLYCQADWTSKTYDVSDSFSEIVATSGINLKVAEGSTNILTYACNNKDFLEQIKVVNSAGRVTISVEKSSIFKRNYNVKCEGNLTIAKDPTYIEASHGTNLSFSNIDTKDITILSKNGSNLEGDITGTNIIAETKSGSNMELSGRSNTTSFDVESGSNLNAKKLNAKSCIANVSGGSNADIHAESELNIKATMGSNISYYGNPANVTKSAKGGSSISKN